MRIRRSRSSVDGRYVTAAQAAADPAGTVTETVPAPSPVIEAAWDLCNTLREHGDLDLLSTPGLAAYDHLMETLNA